MKVLGEPISYLKCDNLGCSGLIEFDRDLVDSDVGTPCPICSSDMLTLPDFKQYLAY